MIDADDWDPKNEIVKGKTMQVKEINQHLEDIRFQIKSRYRELRESRQLILFPEQRYMERIILLISSLTFK